MTYQTFFQKIGNYFIFKGNVNRISFLFLLFFAEFANYLAFELVRQLYYIFPDFDSVISLCEIGRGILLCYLLGIAIVARLRNLKLNPSIAYFYVVFLWLARYFMINMSEIPFFVRIEFYGMIIFLALIPLFVKDKKVLQFWK